MRKYALMMACAAGALCANAAHAADATADATATDASTASGATIVSDLVITAGKREQTVQTIATAVTAYSQTVRQVVGIDSITDLQNFTPGLRYSASLDRIFLRGVGRQTNNLATDPGVATFVDGVYDAATYDAGGDAMFIARTEVLRGPQGTLYGRNSIGGDINVVSVMPTNTFYAEGRANVGSYGTTGIEAVTSGPIAEGLTFRVGAAYSDVDKGYFRNVARPGQTEDGNATNAYFEGQLQYKNDRFELWGKATYSQYGGTYRATNVVTPYDTQEFAPGTLGPNLAFAYNPAFIAEGGTFTQVGSVTSNPAVANQWLYNTSVPSTIKIDPNYAFTWHATWHADGFDVKYLGGWAHHFLEIDAGFGGSPVSSLTIPLAPGSDCAAGGAQFGFPFVIAPFGAPCSGPFVVNGPTLDKYIENKSWTSHEIDFVSTGNSSFQWLGGLYYYTESYNQSTNFTLPNQAQVATPLVAFTGPAAAEFDAPSAPVFAAPNPTRSILDSGEDMQGSSYAGFGQIDWKFTPAWKLTAGIRYSYDNKSGTEFLRELCISCANFLGAGFLPENLGSLTPVYDVTSPTSGFIFTGSSPGAGPVQFNSTTGFASRHLFGHWAAVTGTLGVEWSPDPDLLVYAKYSRGYKAGGFNAGSITATPEVGPESLDDFEGGVKKTFGHSLTVDAAAFYYIYDNMQIELGELGNGGTTTFFLQGVPQVHNFGFELESYWQATNDLQFILSYAYLNTDIVKSACYQDPVSISPSSASCIAAGSAATGVFNVQGNHLIDSPPNKLAINANYTLHFEPGNLIFSASDTWTDGHFSALFNTPDYFAPGYNNLDLRLLWNDSKDRYTIILYGKNVLNEVQYDYIYPGTSRSTVQGGGAALVPQVTHSLNAPLTYGIQFQVRFR